MIVASHRTSPPVDPASPDAVFPVGRAEDASGFIRRSRGGWIVDWRRKGMNWVANAANLRFIETVASVGPRGKLLDVGAGNCPFRPVLEACGWRYESCDWPNSMHQEVRHDYYCDASSIPVPDQRYDAVLCTEVLEHVGDPERVLGEFQRILVPGGRLFLTVPFLHGEHEAPHDHSRFTRYRIREMLRRQGFVVSHLEARSELVGTMLVFGAQLLNLVGSRCFRTVGLGGTRFRRSLPFLVAAVSPQMLYLRLMGAGRRGRFRQRWWEMSEAWTCGFHVVAERLDRPVDGAIVGRRPGTDATIDL